MLKKSIKIIFLKIIKIIISDIEILIISDFNSINILLIYCYRVLQFQSVKITVKTVHTSNKLICRLMNYLTIRTIEFNTNISRDSILVKTQFLDRDDIK